jgi:hypothetical protein
VVAACGCSKITRTNLAGKKFTLGGTTGTILGLGQLLKVPELAEGVESDAQLALFAAEGCNEVLGYLIGDRNRLFASTCHEWLECRVGSTCWLMNELVDFCYWHF